MLYYIIYKYHCTVIQIDIILYVHITRIDPSNIIQFVSLKQDRNTLIHDDTCLLWVQLVYPKIRVGKIQESGRLCSPYDPYVFTISDTSKFGPQKYGIL